MPTQQGKYTTADIAPTQAGTYSSADLQGNNPAPSPKPPRPLMSQVEQGAKDFGKGILKGGMSTVANLDDIARKHLPNFMTNQWFGMGKPTDIAKEHQMAETHNTAQDVGKGAEQVGEFFIPGGAEEGTAAHLGELAPKIKPLLRIGTSALGAGAVNKAQGGSFAGGAAGGALGGAVGEGLRAVAPHIAESALNIRKTDRAYEKGSGAIGRAALDETSGFTPGKVAESAQGRLNELNPQLESAADKITTPTASMSAPRQVLTDASGKAARQGERTTMSQLEPMETHLNEDISGTPIPSDVTPRQLLDLKRGFGNEFIHRWNPDTMNGVKGTAAQTYHAMGNEFNRVVPEAQELNGRISRLIPVAKRAESAELNAPTVQRMAHRVGAHTGAMATGLFGGYQGYEKGGIPGAVAGAVLGTAVPEALTSPTGEMAIARLLNRSAPLTRTATGTALQLDRKNKNTDGN